MNYVVALVICVIGIVSLWILFKKAGDKGWKAIIPFYNSYTSFKLFWKTSMFWVMLVVALVVGVLSGTVSARILIDGMSGVNIFLTALVAVLCIVSLVINIIFNHKLSKSFGHGAGFTVGLVLLNPIFMLILAFGSSEYVGNRS